MGLVESIKAAADLEEAHAQRMIGHAATMLDITKQQAQVIADSQAASGDTRATLAAAQTLLETGITLKTTPAAAAPGSGSVAPIGGPTSLPSSGAGTQNPDGTTTIENGPYYETYDRFGHLISRTPVAKYALENGPGGAPGGPGSTLTPFAGNDALFAEQAAQRHPAGNGVAVPGGSGALLSEGQQETIANGAYYETYRITGGTPQLVSRRPTGQYALQGGTGAAAGAGAPGSILQPFAGNDAYLADQARAHALGKNLPNVAGGTLGGKDVLDSLTRLGDRIVQSLERIGPALTPFRAKGGL